MSNLRRTDGSTDSHQRSAGQVASQEPIVLARLPRIGSPNIAATVTPVAQAPAPPPAETLPQLELRDQISQRIKLHVATAPAEPGTPPSSPTTHFADRKHPTHSEPILRQPAPDSQRSRSRRRTHSSTSRPRSDQLRSDSRPATLGEKLFQLHGSLSPHAGLIVALALIASAALLYWMIVGPTQAPAPVYQDFGNELERNGFGAIASPSGRDYATQFTAELPQAEASPSASERWNRVDAAAPMPAVETPLQLPKPTLEPAQRSSPTASSTSPYPMSSFPNQLDLTKAMQTPMSPASSDVARGLPEVANRNTGSTAR